MKVNQLLILVALIGFSLGGLVLVMRKMRGNQHWIMSVQDQPGGMTLLIGTATSRVPDSIERPEYQLVVKGLSLGHDIKPFVLDESASRLPKGWVRTHLDTTILPGACRISIGPLFLDFCSAFLDANGVSARPGEQIEVVIASAAQQARPVPIGP